MSTPMLQQYKELKIQYSDCILLFRLGDFYECFYDDAKILSKVLGITLTGRGKDENRIPMAGIPYHALEQYLHKLVKANYKIAIAEQMQEATPGQLVERDVVKVITAGTLLDEKILDPTDNNYIVSLTNINYRGKLKWGLSYADISTAEFKVLEYISISDNNSIPREILTEIYRLRPSELVISRKIVEPIRELFEKLPLQIFEEIDYDQYESVRYILTKFGIKNLQSFGLEDYTVGIMSASVLYRYLENTQKTSLKHITKLLPQNNNNYMLLDQATIRNLELIFPMQQGISATTFYDVLNNCKTPMGQRMLRNWILRPLINKEKIENRLNTVDLFVKDQNFYQSLENFLTEITDLERILSRLGTKNVNARDLIFLKNGVKSSLSIIKLILDSPYKHLQQFSIKSEAIDRIDKLLISLIDKAIIENPPLTISEGNIIKQGFSEELDLIKEQEAIGKQYIKNLENSEISKTGISSLKVSYNKVFGYYIEISKSNISKVPENYIRKQTLANAERYITEELKIWEEKVLGATEKLAILEYKIFEDIRDQLLNLIPDIQSLCIQIAQIDCLINFAKIAIDRNYSKPNILDEYDQETQIIDGRHPVVDYLKNGEFVPNDSRFNQSNNQVAIITGPNMSGKSTYIRQVALIFIMAQIGSFVPASVCDIVVADRVFTRVGASDNLSAGESTFMVEMNETANILNNATMHSLIILDEVGRGTSTYDGVAIAWSIVEYIVHKIKCKTLFATHYHELIGLEDKLASVKNYNVLVQENNGKIIFMHKIIEGATDRSYGVHVAKLSGIPDLVIDRAEKILNNLESGVYLAQKSFERKKTSLPEEQLSFVVEKKNDKYDEVLSQIKNLDIDNMTPLESLVKLKEIKSQL
jgi:DNA mismatch repair protein MutS